MKSLVAIMLLMTFFVLCDGGTFYVPWSLSELDQTIVMALRLPRTLLAFIVGGGLALCGAIFQALFKNDLASPYTLGTASTSALGACLALFWGYRLYFPFLPWQDRLLVFFLLYGFYVKT